MAIQDQSPDSKPYQTRAKSYSVFNRLFKWNYGHPSLIPVYQARNLAFESNDPPGFLQQKLEDYASKLDFPPNSELKEYDDRLALEYKNKVLQVYKASDAVMFYDRDLVAPATPQFAQNLPDESQCVQKSEAILSDLGLTDDSALFTQYLGLDYTVAIQHQGGNNPPEVYRTEVSVCYGFSLDGLPVFGPGGKMQSRFVLSDVQLSELISFWRTPQTTSGGELTPITKKRLVSPRCALFKLAWRKRFFRIILWDWAKLRIDSIELGYYAAPPFVLQDVYPPVYRIKGTIKPRKEHSYEFSYFISAVHLSKEEQNEYGWPFSSKTVLI